MDMPPAGSRPSMDMDEELTLMTVVSPRLSVMVICAGAEEVIEAFEPVAVAVPPADVRGVLELDCVWPGCALEVVAVGEKSTWVNFGLRIGKLVEDKTHLHYYYCYYFAV
jgi:hypothetical protein